VVRRVGGADDVLPHAVLVAVVDGDGGAAGAGWEEALFAVVVDLVGGHSEKEVEEDVVVVVVVEAQRRVKGYKMGASPEQSHPQHVRMR
jgi:hypothetical protein